MIVYGYTVDRIDDETVSIFTSYRCDDSSEGRGGAYAEEVDLDTDETVPFPDTVEDVEILCIRECTPKSRKLTVSSLDIQPMRNLSVLRLIGCSIVGEVERLFSSMSTLSSIKMTYCTVHSKGLLSSISTLSSLQSLKLDSVTIPNDDAADVLIIEHMSKLTKVLIDCLDIAVLPIPPKSIEHYSIYQYGTIRMEGRLDTIDWSKYTNLKSVAIYGSNLTGTVPDSLLSMTNLKELTLSNNRLEIDREEIVRKTAHIDEVYIKE